MRKITVLLIIFIIIGVGFLSGCSTTSPPNISNTNPTGFVVASQIKRSELEGFNKVGYVDVTVKNFGVKGNVTIYVTAWQGSNRWSQRQTVILGENEVQTFTFRFTEINFWTLTPWDCSVTLG